MQNLTTFNFDREYLPNGSNCLQPLPRWTKKDGELWSKNKKVIGVNVESLTHPSAISARFRTTFYFDSQLLRAEFEPTKLSFQSDLRRRAALRWALPHISSWFCDISSSTCYKADVCVFVSVIVVPSMRPVVVA